MRSWFKWLCSRGFESSMAVSISHLGLRTCIVSRRGPAEDRLMSWMDCPRIDVRKAVAVLIVMIAVTIVSVVICRSILMQAGADGTVTIACCAAILLVEPTVFRFLQDTMDERLYFRKDRWSEDIAISNAQVITCARNSKGRT